MKTYRYVGSIPPHAKALLDQPGHIHQCALIVAATSLASAATLIRETGVDCSPYLLKTYGAVTGAAADVEMAAKLPDQVWAQALAGQGGEYFAVMPRALYLERVTGMRYNAQPDRDDLACCIDCTTLGRGRYVIARDDIPKHNEWHEGIEIEKSVAARAAKPAVPDHGIRAVPTAKRYEVRQLDVFGVVRWIVWDNLIAAPYSGLHASDDAAKLALDLAIKTHAPEHRFPWPPANS